MRDRHRPRAPRGDDRLHGHAAGEPPATSTRPRRSFSAAVLYVFRALVGRTSRSTPAACGRSRSCVPRAVPAESPAYPARRRRRATSRRRSASSTCCSARSALRRRARHHEQPSRSATRACQYYETICGGAGAGAELRRRDAVHTHMTNTRITDPEVLEARYPVRVRRFEIRRGSGGRGARRGGDGVMREIEFLEPMHAAILSNRRRVAPFGLAAAARARCGKNYVLRAGRRHRAARRRRASVELVAGDRFVIETPGGGGYGAERSSARGGSRHPVRARPRSSCSLVIAEIVGHELVRRAAARTRCEA